MNKFKIKISGKDFHFLTSTYIVKGSRKKRMALGKNKNIMMFKYERSDYNCSEACSEKLAYEIAKILGYKCARIELALDENMVFGVLNYLFSNENIHMDASAFLNKYESERKKYYTIKNIKQTLDDMDKTLFFDFIKIMIFDALIGEQDRHEENWGIIIGLKSYKISPLYDNGCSLLREFKDENFLNKFYSKEKDFETYIKRSQSMIYNEDGKRIKHFDLIKTLYDMYPNFVKLEILNLKKLSDKKIITIVNKIPDNLITLLHKKFIIEYLIKRRDILLDIIEG